MPIDGEIVARARELGRELRQVWEEQRKSVDAVRLKEDGTVISNHDVRIERALVQIIERRDHRAVILGEELGYSESRDARRNGRPLYLIDPIDGTHAFVSGSPSFATTITRVDPQGSIEAVIVLPAYDVCVTVDREGARATDGFAFIRRLSEPGLIRPYDQVLIDSKLHRVVDVQFPGKVRSYGSIVHHAVEVARGAFLAALWLGGNPWDTLPVFALMRAVRGTVEVLGGHELTVRDILDERYGDRDPPVLIAGHPNACSRFAEYFPRRSKRRRRR